MFNLLVKYRVIILIVTIAFIDFSQVLAENVNSECKNTSGAETQQSESRRKVVESKLDLLGSILSQSPTAKRIEASRDNEAIELLQMARNYYNNALNLLDKNCLVESEQHLNNGLRTLGNASQKIANVERNNQIAKQEYEQNLARIKSYQETYQQIISGEIDNNYEYLDEQELDEIVKSAEELNKQENFMQALMEIQKAVLMLEMALTALRDKQTLVYDLKFDSIEDEYAYELETNNSYTKLLTMILDNNSTNSSLDKIEEIVRRNNELKKNADDMLNKGDIESALHFLEQGNENLIFALRYTGIGL